MAANVLQLNQEKTEVLVIGPEGQREKLLTNLQDFKPPASLSGQHGDADAGFHLLSFRLL